MSAETRGASITAITQRTPPAFELLVRANGLDTLAGLFSAWTCWQLKGGTCKPALGLGATVINVLRSSLAEPV